MVESQVEINKNLHAVYTGGEDQTINVYYKHAGF